MKDNDKHHIALTTDGNGNTDLQDGPTKEAAVVSLNEPPLRFRLRLYFPRYRLQAEPALQLGFDVNTALFFSGINTLLFYVVTGGKVPAYLGCSGSTVSAVLTVTSFVRGHGNLNPNISMVQGAMIVLGLVYTAISLLVFVFSYHWLEWFMPPVVVGSIVSGIGLNLVFGSFQQATSTPFNTFMALSTVLSIILISVYAPSPSMRRLCILLGAIVGYVINLICGIKGAGPPIDFSLVKTEPWIRAPQINTPIEFKASAISTMVPIVIVFIAENMGHLKALTSITKTPLDHHLARTYLGDGLAIILSGIVGTAPMTTYAENLIILSVTRIYSSLVIVIAALIAIILGFFTKFGAVVNSIPPGVFGGITFVLYSIIALTGIRIWIDNKVDFTDTKNIFIGVLPMVLACCMQQTLVINSFQLDGIGCATFGAIILNMVLCGLDGIKLIGRSRRGKPPLSNDNVLNP